MESAMLLLKWLRIDETGCDWIDWKYDAQLLCCARGTAAGQSQPHAGHALCNEA